MKTVTLKNLQRRYNLANPTWWVWEGLDFEGCWQATPFRPTHKTLVLPYGKTKPITDYVLLEGRFAFGPQEGIRQVEGDLKKPWYEVGATGVWRHRAWPESSVEAVPVGYLQELGVPGFVYFVSAGHGGPIKIGFSTNVVRRMAELQTANAHRLVLLGTVEGTMDTEAEFHVRFAHLRMEAEWFEHSFEILGVLADNEAVEL